MISVQDSARFIAENAEHVKISEPTVKYFAKEYIKKSVWFEDFKNNPWHPPKNLPYAVDVIFVINSLNFCFLQNGKNQIAINGNHGYFALCAALKRAIREGINIYDPFVYSYLTEKQMEWIFRNDDGHKDCLQLMKERRMILYRNGIQLIRKFNGTFINCLMQCNRSAIKLLDIVLENFHTFRDEAKYKGRIVSFYKRAQILIADLFLMYYPTIIFDDIDKITMFADYRVPQALNYLGILNYSPELKTFIKSTIMTSSHDMEIEIRGCSIHAIELIVKEIRSMCPNLRVNSIIIDYMLWNFRRSFSDKINKSNVDFHKRLTIYY